MPAVLLVAYLIIHTVICVLIYIGIRTRILKFSEQIMPIIALIPGAGIIIAFVADYNSRFDKVGIRKIDIEELHLDDEDLRLSAIENEDQNDAVIPLEEAMSVNDADVRRKLMLDILRQNPNAYIELLQEARMDEDIEVTHYASTAIMELQREYELSLQKSERLYSDNPDDADVIDKYLSNLERYIESGLIDENILFVYRTRYSEVNKKKMLSEPENMEAVKKAVDNYLAMENITEALALANGMIIKWPNREEAWLAKLKVCQSSNDGKEISKVIKEIKNRNIYLSPRGKSILEFWDGKNQGGIKDDRNI